MNNNKFLSLLTLIPPLLTPTGLFMEGSRHVLGVQAANKSLIHFELPSDRKGGRIILHDDRQQPIYVYVNKDKEGFDSIFNLTPDKMMQKVNVIPANDRLLIYLLQRELKQIATLKRSSNIEDVVQILSAVEIAMRRHHHELDRNITSQDWKAFREDFEELHATGKIDTLSKTRTGVCLVKKD